MFYIEKKRLTPRDAAELFSDVTSNECERKNLELFGSDVGGGKIVYPSSSIVKSDTLLVDEPSAPTAAVLSSLELSMATVSLESIELECTSI